VTDEPRWGRRQHSLHVIGYDQSAELVTRHPDRHVPLSGRWGKGLFGGPSLFCGICDRVKQTGRTREEGVSALSMVLEEIDLLLDQIDATILAITYHYRKGSGCENDIPPAIRESITDLRTRRTLIASAATSFGGQTSTVAGTRSPFLSALLLRAHGRSKEN